MAFLDDIGRALLAAGLVTDGATTDWKLMKGYLQDAPDRAVCLYETGGQPPEEQWAVDYPGLQVRVRGKPDDYQACRAKLLELYDFLHGGEVAVNASVSPPGAAFVYIYAQQSGPIPMGQDEKRRPALVQNFRSMKARA